jgi:hypothetical protein
VVSRFTIDSATEFLLGKAICTLSAGLPYPASSPLSNSDAFVNHPSNAFTRAFEVAQFFSMRRGGYGSSWPLAEFWKDKVKPHRKIIDQFIEPILAEALTKRVAFMNEASTDGRKLDTDVETLLSHLLNHTQGFSPIHFLFVRISKTLTFFYQILKS